MPKGSKTCKHCGKVTGPRSFICPVETCRQPFVVKGILADINSPAFQPSKRVEEQILKLADYMEEIDWSNHPVNVRCYDNAARVWESKDGKHRLRYAETFMGIKVGHESPWLLMKINMDPLSHVEWDVVHRFKNLQRALSGYRRLLAGEPVVEKKSKKKAGKKQQKKKLIEKLTENLA